MGVYIPSMKMPRGCNKCEFIDYYKGHWYCHVLNDCLEIGLSYRDEHRDERCPLVPVPPHGRLIDADALFKEMGVTAVDCYECEWGEHGFCKMDRSFASWCENLEDAPTIIPAEEGEK